MDLRDIIRRLVSIETAMRYAGLSGEAASVATAVADLRWQEEELAHDEEE